MCDGTRASLTVVHFGTVGVVGEAVVGDDAVVAGANADIIAPSR